MKHSGTPAVRLTSLLLPSVKVSFCKQGIALDYDTKYFLAL